MQFLLNGIIAGSAYSLVAISFALVYLPARFFHFAHGAVFAWGAYSAYVCHQSLNMPLWIAVPLAVGWSSILGIGLEVAIYRPLRQRRATGLILLVVSLGLYVVLQNLISLFFGDEIKSLRSGEILEGGDFFTARITPAQVSIVLVCVGCALVLSSMFKFTRFGKVLRAVSNDSELAFVHGIDVDRIILGAFAIASALAGLVGILVALDVDMSPTMGLSPLMAGVVAMIIGGVGSIPGAFFGGLMLGLAQQLGVWKVGGQWQEAIAFVILIVFLAVRPQGFLGKSLRRVTV